LLEAPAQRAGDRDVLLALAPFKREAEDPATAVRYLARLAEINPDDPALAGLAGTRQSCLTGALACFHAGNNAVRFNAGNAGARIRQAIDVRAIRFGVLRAWGMLMRPALQKCHG
jgi:hypothetical protein